MKSMFWDLIESKPARLPRRILIYALMVFGIIIFSLPRINEAWGAYGAIFYPAMMIIAIFGVIATLLLNSIPVIIELFIR